MVRASGCVTSRKPWDACLCLLRNVQRTVYVHTWVIKSQSCLATSDCSYWVNFGEASSATFFNPGQYWIADNPCVRGANQTDHRDHLAYCTVHCTVTVQNTTLRLGLLFDDHPLKDRPPVLCCGPDLAVGSPCVAPSFPIRYETSWCGISTHRDAGHEMKKVITAFRG